MPARCRCAARSALAVVFSSAERSSRSCGRTQHRHNSLLDNLVLQAPDTQRSLRAIGLRYVASLGRMGSIAATVHTLVQVFQLLFENRTSLLSRATRRTAAKSGRRGFPAQRPDRGGLTAVSLGRGPSLHDLRQGQVLFVRPLRRYYDLVRILIRVHAHLRPSPS